MTETRIVVVGAGHNGLACAAYLARAGRKVLVLEAAAIPGGAAVTREFAPGFHAPAVAHLLHAPDAELVRELELERHGFRAATQAMKTVALSESGPALVLDGGEAIAGDLSAKDRTALKDFLRRMQGFAAVLGRQYRRAPPRLAWQRWREALPAAALALDLRRLGRPELREFLRIAAINIHDVLEECFETPLLKGTLALDAVLGMHAGPRSGNTVLSYLHRMSGSAGRSGARVYPQDGVAEFTRALAEGASSLGVEIRTGCPVGAITVDGGHVSGVRLASGESIPAGIVVSNADPRTTLLGLLGARHLEAGFARRVGNLRMHGTAAKVHLALTALPAFRGMAAEHLGERIVIAPDADYVERAFNPVKYGEFSPQPVLEITLPTVRDAGLAPVGRHVLSAIVQYAPRELAGGWAPGRERFLEAVLGVLERHAPGLRNTVTAAELLTPEDIEAQFRMGGGHWHHGELALDQFLMLRPLPGAAHYAMPVPGLYLCGAGCHPGGGVMGTAGRNAARAILAGGAIS